MDPDRNTSSHPESTPPHKGGSPRFLPLMIVGLLVMFAIAALILFAWRNEWAAPGADTPAPASQVAPADK